MLNQGSDQAEGLRRVLNRHALLASRQTFLLIGAAASGKTSCALNIGAVFDAQGIPVRFLDGDATEPCADDHHALLVLTPGIDAITRAYALIKREALNHGRRRFAAVVNRARDEASARAVYENIASAARRFLQAGMSYAGYVQDDPALWHGPCVLADYAPEAPAVADYARVARTLAGMRTPLPAVPGEGWVDPLSELFQQRRRA